MAGRAAGKSFSCYESGAVLSEGGLLALREAAQPWARSRAVCGQQHTQAWLCTSSLRPSRAPSGSPVSVSDSSSSSPRANVVPGPGRAARGRQVLEQKPPLPPVAASPSLGALQPQEASSEGHGDPCTETPCRACPAQAVNPAAEKPRSGAWKPHQAARSLVFWFQVCLLFSESALL